MNRYKVYVISTAMVCRWKQPLKNAAGLLSRQHIPTDSNIVYTLYLLLKMFCAIDFAKTDFSSSPDYVGSNFTKTSTNSLSVEHLTQKELSVGGSLPL